MVSPCSAEGFVENKLVLGFANIALSLYSTAHFDCTLLHFIVLGRFYGSWIENGYSNCPA